MFNNKDSIATTYSDIKNRVMEVTHNLQYAPTYLVEQYLNDQWEFRNVSFTSVEMDAINHASIRCVVHCMIKYDSRRIHTVRSVLVDDVPAFFFVAGGREGSDYFMGYILDKDTLKKYIKYIAMTVIEESYQRATGFLPEYLPEVENKDLDDEDMIYVDECTIVDNLGYGFASTSVDKKG